MDNICRLVKNAGGMGNIKLAVTKQMMLFVKHYSFNNYTVFHIIHSLNSNRLLMNGKTIIEIILFIQSNIT